MFEKNISKKGLCIFIFFFSWFWTSNAQPAFKANGFIGLNLSQIDGDRMDGFNKLGFRLAFQVGRDFKKDFSYYIELAYSQKGSRRIYNENGPVGGIWDLAKTDYIELPLFLGWRRNKHIEFQGGLHAGFLARSSVFDYNFGYTSTEFIRKGELGFLLGVNYQINRGWSAGFRYQQSILSVAQSGIPIWNTYTNILIHKVLGFQMVYHLNPS